MAADDRPRCVALARLLLVQLRVRGGVELPASLLAVEALDGGARDAPALAWSALHSAPDGAARVVARAVARLVEHGARPMIGSGLVRGDALRALHALGVEQRAAYDVVHAAWDAAGVVARSSAEADGCRGGRGRRTIRSSRGGPRACGARR